jgi:RimJ/RimL family protein N-acetyltransferase
MELATRRLRLVLQTREQVEAFIAAMPEHDRAQVSPEWLARMRGSTPGDPWAFAFQVLLRETDAAVGTCSFKGPPVDGVVEISYATDAAHTGRGYATEAALAMRDFAASRRDVRCVRAHTLPEGAASQRILEKCGFRYVGDVVDPEDGLVSRFEVSTAGLSPPGS